MGVLDYSTTPGSNTSINGIGIQGTNSVLNFDNALRQFMADIASDVTREVVKVAGTYTAVKADYRQLWRATGAATFNLTAAATLTSGWSMLFMADGGAITVDPNASELINGASTLTIADGTSALVLCTGTAFRAIVIGNGTVTLTGTQTLTNKTLTSPTINSPTVTGLDASESAKGLIEIATAAEIAAASSNVLAVTPGRQKDSLAWFTITYAASIPVAHTNGKNQVVTLTGNGAFAAPSGGIPGETLDIRVIQDGTGNRVPTWNSAYDFGDYGTPTLSTGASQEDLLGFKCISSGKFVFYGMRRRTD